MTDPELSAILDAVAKFTEVELAPNAVDWDQRSHFPVDVLHRAGMMGLGGICVAEDVGGVDLPRSVSVQIFEELAKGDTAIAPYISIHNMVSTMIDRHGDAQQRQTWLPAMCEMDVLGSYCLTEPDAGSDAGNIRTTARVDGETYVLNGVKQFISGAGSSGTYVVMARTEDTGPRGITAFIVPKDMPGLSFGANERKMGWHAQPTRQVVFDDCRVPTSHRLGAEREGFAIAMGALNGGRLNIAACSLGGAQVAVERALTHLATRKAFGRLLIEQQALVFRLANAATQLAAGRALLAQAAGALDRGDPDATVQCAMAKKFVTDASFEAANTALQMLGGYGYLADYGMEKIVRDLRVHQILEGTNEIMQLIVGRALVEGVA